MTGAKSLSLFFLWVWIIINFVLSGFSLRKCWEKNWASLLMFYGGFDFQSLLSFDGKSVYHPRIWKGLSLVLYQQCHYIKCRPGKSSAAQGFILERPTWPQILMSLNFCFRFMLDRSTTWNLFTARFEENQLNKRRVKNIFSMHVQYTRYRNLNTRTILHYLPLIWKQ